jgi:hypothetical protein
MTPARALNTRPGDVTFAPMGTTGGSSGTRRVLPSYEILMLEPETWLIWTLLFPRTTWSAMTLDG